MPTIMFCFSSVNYLVNWYRKFNCANTREGSEKAITFPLNRRGNANNWYLLNRIWSKTIWLPIVQSSTVQLCNETSFRNRLLSFKWIIFRQKWSGLSLHVDRAFQIATLINCDLTEASSLSLSYGNVAQVRFFTVAKTKKSSVHPRSGFVFAARLWMK